MCDCLESDEIIISGICNCDESCKCKYLKHTPSINFNSIKQKNINDENKRIYNFVISYFNFPVVDCLKKIIFDYMYVPWYRCFDSDKFIFQLTDSIYDKFSKIVKDHWRFDDYFNQFMLKKIDYPIKEKNDNSFFLMDTQRGHDYDGLWKPPKKKFVEQVNYIINQEYIDEIIKKICDKDYDEDSTDGDYDSNGEDSSNDDDSNDEDESNDKD